MDRSEIKRLQTIYKAAYIAGKKNAVNLFEEGDIENSLKYINACGSFAHMYTTGIWYDDELETLVDKIGHSLAGKLDLPDKKESLSSQKKIVYLASFLQETGGHSEVCRMWLKLLNKDFEQHVFVTGALWSGLVDFNIPQQFLSKLDGTGLNIEVIKGSGYVERIRNLAAQIKQIDPDFVVLFIVPGDVIALCSLMILRNCFKQKIKVIYYNHTDITFWMGKQITDIVADYSGVSAYLIKALKGWKGDVAIIPLTTDINLKQQSYETPFNKDFGQTVSVSIGHPWKIYKDEFWDYFATIKKILKENPKHMHILLTLKADFIEKEISSWDVDLRERLKVVYGEGNPFKYYKISDFYIDTFPFAGIQARIEAFSAGLPVLFIDNHNFRLAGLTGQFLLKNDRYTYIASNNEELIKYANQLIANPELRADLRQTIGATFNRYYSTESARNSLISLFTNSIIQTDQDSLSKYKFDFDDIYVFSNFTRFIGLIDNKIVDILKIILAEDKLHTYARDEESIVRDYLFYCQISRLKKAIEEKDRQIAERDQQIVKVAKEKDQQIETITRTFKSEKDAIISNFTHETENLHNQKDAKERELIHIYKSDGWKALMFYYKVRNFLSPPDSFRKKILNSCFKFLKSIAECRKLLTKGLSGQTAATQTTISQIQHPWEYLDLYQRWIGNNILTSTLHQWMRKDADALVAKGSVLISVIVPVYNAKLEFLQQMISSIQTQIYPKWELCIADDASTDPKIRPYLEEISRADPRIKVLFRPKNGHIVEASNSALSLCTGDFIALLDHDDELSKDALLHVAECIEKNPDVDWIYTDEDKIDANGNHYDPLFKGAWSPEMALTHNYTQHLTVIRRSLVEKVGGFRRGYEGAQDLDLYLRVAEATSPDRVAHIPFICYHWRAHGGSTASDGAQKRYVFDSAERAINDALDRRGLHGKAVLPEFASKNHLCLNQVKWDYNVMRDMPVTIIIPTKNRVDLLRSCIKSLELTVNPDFVRLIIVDDRSTDPETLEYLENLPKSCQLSTKVVKPKRSDGRFNFARLINEAAEYVETSAMLILNNDIEATEPGWLEDMVGWLSVQSVSAVGARLLYSDQRVQHAGVIIGPYDGLADHYFIGQHKDELGYVYQARIARNVSAVTAACMLTKVETYRKLKGMDEQKFAVAYNDVDYCLRIWKSGERVVYTPQATLTHHTGASRGQDYDPTEHINFIERYRNCCDSFVNPSMNQSSTNFEINPYYVVHADRIRKLKVLMITHKLDLGGGPIVAYELARYLKEREDFEVETVSLVNGPLRKRYEENGLSIRVLEGNHNLEYYPDILFKKAEKIGNELELEQYDLVSCSTVESYWGVEIARRFNRPVIWHIHESATVEEYFRNWLPAVTPLVKNCFQYAQRIVFASKATAAVFQYLNSKDRMRIVPGGLPLDRIEAFRNSNSKIKLRSKYNLPVDRKIVTIIGTTCERKGQHIFVSAVEQLRKTLPPDTPCPLFLIVGGREGEYLDKLRLQVKSVGSEMFQLVMETPDIYDFFALSDMFVCSSFMESFPTVVLLAMAFELPIVSSNVYGVPEMLEDNVDGLLVPPGQPMALAEAIKRILLDPRSAKSFGNHAWFTIQRRFNNNKLMPRQARLFREAVACWQGKI